MPRILIISQRDDAHQKAVSWGLRALGHAPVVWDWEEFPKDDAAALLISQRREDQFFLRAGATRHAGPFDVVWMRRRGEPAPVQGTHPDDLKAIHADSKQFFDNALPVLGHAGTRWVNHPDADYRCANKLHQLRAARMLGFGIPDTLIGNDIDAVRYFFTRHPEGVVHKSFSRHFWENEDGSHTYNRTAQITAAHLSREFAVRACPGIYQAKVEKKHELRVTVMGNTVLGALIDSQRDGPTVDWRYEGGHGINNLKATDLAPELAERCRILCRQLGLAFGCIDLIVTPEDDVVFLEINCAGQFLFKELVDPAMPMLDTFCRFLIHGDDQAKGAAGSRLAFADYLASEPAPAWLKVMTEMMTAAG